MRSHVELFDQLSKLLEYPRDHIAAEADCCRRLSMEKYPEIANEISEFCDQVEKMTTEELQELYTRTFDINPVCALEVGWQLFGEHYTRGEFLAWVRGELRDHGVSESKELPDHLTHVLRLIGRMDETKGRALNENYLVPAITKMLEGFKDKTNPYAGLLSVIKTSLHKFQGQVPEGVAK